MSLSNKRVLLVSHRPTQLVQELACRLLGEGAHVTLVLRHAQDAQHLVRRLGKRPSSTEGALDSAPRPLNVARLASIHEFAASINSSSAPLDLLVLDSWDLHAAGRKDRRWYTSQGVTGTAQTGFIGPAVLLHLLRPKMAASGTAVLLTASPSHRLAALDDLQDTLTTWGHTTLAATQAALLAYVRQLARQLHHQGVRAAAVDLGVLGEQPLKGSLLRKLPGLWQALHILLPSAHDAAGLLANVASHMLADTAAGPGSTPAGAAVAGHDTADQPAELGEQAAPRSSSSPSPSQAEAAAAAAAGSGPSTAETCWDAESTDTPGFDLPAAPEGPQPPTVAAAAAGAPLAHLQPAQAEADGADALGVPDVEPDTDQSAAFDIGHSLGKAVKTAKAVAQANTGAAMEGLRGVGSTVGDAAGAAAGAALGEASLSGAPGAAVSLEASIASKPFSYISRGLLASPLVIAFDYAGSSTWPTRTLHALAGPLYSLTSSTLITAASLADWPVRLLLRPAESALPALLSALGPVGSLATRLVAQVQGLVPGVVGVPPDAPPAWVEVTPSGVVLDERLGWMLWHLVQGYAGVQAG